MSAAFLGTGNLLDGVRLLDASVWRPGPYASQLLAEIGADVIKIEPPGGDPMRMYPDLFASLNANKKSVLFDLKDPADRAAALGLAAEADVVLEGFRPGVADRLGIGYDAVSEVNPTVIYCSISGMGQDGPLADAPGHDLNYQAWSGILAPEGGPPVVPAVPIADLAAGVTAAFGICAAIVRRSATGEGERLDVAMGDILATWTGAAAARSSVEGGGDHKVPGYGTYQSADGSFLALGVVTEDHFWHSLCEVLGLDEARELDFASRSARGRELDASIKAVVAGRQRDELVAQLLAANVPASPVLDRAGMVALPHFGARGVVTADPWRDPTTGYPIRLRHHPAGRHRAPPALDEHRGTGFSPR